MSKQQAHTISINGKNVLLLVIPVLAWYFGKFTTDWFTAGNIHLFLLQFLSLFIEAAPFLLVGSIVSGLIEVFVRPETLLRLIPKGRIAQVFVGSCLGLVFPVCECGVVPVVRRLFRKGMPAIIATQVPSSDMCIRRSNTQQCVCQDHSYWMIRSWKVMYEKLIVSLRTSTQVKTGWRNTTSI